MERKMLTRLLGCSRSIPTAILLASALLMMMMMTTGVAKATALPVTVAFNCTPLNGSGCLNGGGYSVQVLANSCVNFFNGSPDACGSSDTYTSVGPTDPTVFTLGATGTQKDLPFGSTLPITAFLTIPGPLGTVSFDLTSVVMPNSSACPPGSIPGACSLGIFTFLQSDLDLSGSNCPPGVSTCGDVSVQFSAFANAYTGSSATGVTPYKITYTSQFTNETTTDLIAKAFSAGGITNSVSFSATPLSTTTVPEPTALILVGAGLMGISLISKRRRGRV
jgi:hypothetical protein